MKRVSREGLWRHGRPRATAPVARPPAVLLTLLQVRQWRVRRSGWSPEVTPARGAPRIHAQDGRWQMEIDWGCQVINSISWLRSAESVARTVSNWFPNVGGATASTFSATGAGGAALAAVFLVVLVFLGIL